MIFKKKSTESPFLKKVDDKYTTYINSSMRVLVIAQVTWKMKNTSLLVPAPETATTSGVAPAVSPRHNGQDVPV